MLFCSAGGGADGHCVMFTWPNTNKKKLDIDISKLSCLDCDFFVSSMQWQQDV